MTDTVQDLHTLYLQSIALWRELRVENTKLSAPFAVVPTEAYDTAATRLMVVGQQTMGWDVPDDGGPAENIVDLASDLYRNFDLGARERGSPFWSAAHQVFRALNPDATTAAFIWDNLVKMDCAGFRVPPQIEDRLASLPLLQTEILIYKPQVVVFFTGPQYDSRLLATFPGAQFVEISKQLGRVVHPDLPARTFRTYHPKYLRMSRHWDALQELSSLCLAT